jgi:hypothetical protein
MAITCLVLRPAKIISWRSGSCEECFQVMLGREAMSAFPIKIGLTHPCISATRDHKNDPWRQWIIRSSPS